MPTSTNSLSQKPVLSAQFGSGSGTIGCIADALGIGTFVGAVGKGGVKAIAKSAIKGVIKGLLRAAVPVVGLAVSVVSFGICMDWI